MLVELMPLAPGVRFILNAGGLNPLGAQAALIAALEKRGIRARVAAVTGDSLFARVGELQAAGTSLSHMDTGHALDAVRDRLVFLNAYLGARPIVEALETGADIVISGRVADAALFLAPLVHELGWDWNDYDRLAQGVVVGHLLECSGQASGGNFGGDWRGIPDLAHIGYPIAEVSEDGSALITKAPQTGGRVNFDTLREQLLYEVHDPTAYLTPDVAVDLSEVVLEDLGEDRVRVTGARGSAPPPTLKAVGGYHDGWMGQGMIGYSWPGALDKARVAARIIETQMAESGIAAEELRIEYLGYDSLHGPLAPEPPDLPEVYLRMAIRTADKAIAARFTRLFPPLGLSGPPFVGGYGGMTPPRELLGIWPTLVPRGIVESEVSVHVVDA